MLLPIRFDSLIQLEQIQVISFVSIPIQKMESILFYHQYTHNNGISSDSWFKNDHFLSKWKIDGNDVSMLNEIKILLYSNTINYCTQSYQYQQ